MEIQRKSTRKYWVWCFAWTTLMIIMLAMPSLRPFFWLALPGATTYFALALDLI